MTQARAFVARRRALDLSQAEVARRMGTSRNVVSRLEAGLVDPRVSTLERWGAALDGSLGWTFEPAEPAAVLAGFEDLQGCEILSRGLADLAVNRVMWEALAIAVVAPIIERLLSFAAAYEALRGSRA